MYACGARTIPTSSLLVSAGNSVSPSSEQVWSAVSSPGIPLALAVGSGQLLHGGLPPSTLLLLSAVSSGLAVPERWSRWPHCCLPRRPSACSHAVARLPSLPPRPARDPCQHRALPRQGQALRVPLPPLHSGRGSLDVVPAPGADTGREPARPSLSRHALRLPIQAS